MSDREGGFAWATIRSAKEQAGRRCRHCGKTEGEIVEEYVEQGGQMVQKTKKVRLHAHHLFPINDSRSKLGKYTNTNFRKVYQHPYSPQALSTDRNIQILCEDCHHEAHHKAPDSIEMHEARNLFYSILAEELLQIANNIQNEKEHPSTLSPYALALRHSQ